MSVLPDHFLLADLLKPIIPPFILESDRRRYKATLGLLFKIRTGGKRVVHHLATYHFAQPWYTALVKEKGVLKENMLKWVIWTLFNDMVDRSDDAGGGGDGGGGDGDGGGVMY